MKDTKVLGIDKRLLRWAAVPFAAVGGYVGVVLLSVLGNLINDDPIFWVKLANSFFAPVAFVYAGAYTAPQHRFMTGIILTTIHTLFVGVTLTLAHVYGTPTPFAENAIFSGIGIFGTISAVYALKEDEDKKGAGTKETGKIAN